VATVDTSGIDAVQESGIDAGRESSLALLERARAGDRHALETLLSRYRPRLSRWAHRRLPIWARDLSDTDDLVQDTLVKAIRNLDAFASEHQQGFQNYLRLAMINAVRDHVRRARRRPTMEPLDPQQPNDEESAFDRAVGRQRLARYEAALSRLTSAERDAVVARLEFGFTHAELAAVLGKDTADAARKLCRKALGRLVSFMADLA